MFPKIAEIGPLTLHSYGLLLALAFLAGIWWTSRLAPREGVDPDTVWNVGLIVIASSLVGAKLLLILVEWDYYGQNPGAVFSINTLKSGGVFLGGLIAALAATAYYFHRKKLPGWAMADLFAPGLALGHAIGRLGCFSAGCCYGSSCTLPWAVTYTSEYARATIGVPLNVALHPTQLYESLAELAVFGLLMWLRKRRAFEGQIVLTYLLTYAVIRFLLEFLRSDPRGQMFDGMLSTSQFIILITLPALLYFYLSRRRVPPVVAPRRARRNR